MADDDALDGMGEGEVSGPSEKKRGLGGLFNGLLKWVIIAIAAILVICVVVFFALKFTHKNNTKYDPVPMSEEYVSGQREIFDWYTSLGTIQTTTYDDPPATVRVEVVLGYKKDDKATSTEITQRTVELKSFLRRFFNSKTAVELRNPNNEAALENEIKNGINDKILSNSKIRDVKFLQKDVIQQN